MVLAALLVVATVAALTVGGRVGVVTAYVDDRGLGPAATPIAILIVVLVVAALIELCRMLRCIEAGNIFGPDPVQRFRRFAWILFAASVTGVTAPWIASMVAAARGEDTHVVLGLEATDGLLILLSVVLILIARMLDAAAIYQEDSRSFL